MARYCREVQEWIEEEIEKPVEEWVEKRVRKCKRRKCKKWCLCCNKWFCWIETFLEKVITWVVVTVGKWVTRVVCEVIHLVIDVIGFVVGLVLAIPIIGRLIKEIWNVIIEIGNRILGLPDLILCAFGVMWTKKLRICIIILRIDEKTPTATPESLKPDIDKAVRIYKDAANVDFVVEGIHTVNKPSPSRNLDVSCGAGAWWEDLWLEGSYFEVTANTQCFDGIARRITGFASPVIVFVVRDVGDKLGCSVGPLSDYVTVEGDNPICLAHEVAHACSLWHHGNREYLMNGRCGGTKLKKWQKCLLRNSRHVTFL